MKLVFDLLPVILFFLAYQLAGSHEAASHALATTLLGPLPASQAPILLATIVAILATLLQVTAIALSGRRVERMMWISLALILAMGGLTLAFHNPDFIKWKPTALYWVFALSLWGSSAFLGKNLIRAALESRIRLPMMVWNRLNLAWSAFFTAMGGLNLAIAYAFSEAVWVNFKMFGSLLLTFAFVLAQGVYLSRHAQPIEEENTA